MTVVTATTNVASETWQGKWLPRMSAILVMAIFHFTVPFYGKKDLAGFLHSSGLQDLGHGWIPALIDSFSKAQVELIWYLGTCVFEIIVVSLVISVLFFGKGMRLGIAIFAMKSLHWLAWHFTVLPIPDQIVWEFPSWVISAGMPFTQDLWFSGHVATSTLLALSAMRTQQTWLKALCWLFVAFEAWLVLACRTHYSIDVLGGLAVAYCFHRISLDIEIWARRQYANY